MRRSGLLKSVVRILGEGTEVRDAVYAWARHRWITPLAAVVLAAIVFLTPLAGVDLWSTRIALGLAGLAITVMATTDYRVLARTDTRLVLLKASRIRQVATSYLQDLDLDVPFEETASVGFNIDWQVGDFHLTVPKSSEEAMERIAGRTSLEN